MNSFIPYSDSESSEYNDTTIIQQKPQYNSFACFAKIMPILETDIQYYWIKDGIKQVEDLFPYTKNKWEYISYKKQHISLSNIFYIQYEQIDIIIRTLQNTLPQLQYIGKRRDINDDTYKEILQSITTTDINNTYNNLSYNLLPELLFQKGQGKYLYLGFLIEYTSDIFNTKKIGLFHKFIECIQNTVSSTNNTPIYFSKPIFHISFARIDVESITTNIPKSIPLRDTYVSLPIRTPALFVLRIGIYEHLFTLGSCKN